MSTEPAEDEVVVLRREVTRLQEVVAELTDFVSVVTHDLQEPLRSITGFGDLLRRHGADSSPQQREEYLGYIVDAAGRAQERIAGLAHYVRLGARPLDLRPIDLGQVVASAIEASADELAEVGGSAVIDGELPTVTADPTLLGDVARELIANAIRFRHPDRALRIEIRSRGRGDRRSLVVADNGIGVGPEHRTRVLGLFERLHSRSEYPGHGFGLAVAERVVARHGGRLELADGIDGGLAVELDLPAGT